MGGKASLPGVGIFGHRQRAKAVRGTLGVCGCSRAWSQSVAEWDTFIFGHSAELYIKCQDVANVKGSIFGTL